MDKTHPLVVIVHPGALGDVLLAVEAIREVRKAFPLHRVVWVGQSEVGKFLLDCDEVHEVMGIEGSLLSQFFTHSGHFDDQVKGLLKRCTHCVCWMNDREEKILNNLQLLGIRSIIQSPQSPGLKNYHHEERFLRTLRPWKIVADSLKNRKPLFNKVSSPSEFDYLRSQFDFLDRPFIVLHPGSGSRHKCVAPSFMVEVARGLLKHSGINLVILSGPADQCHVDRLLAEIPSGMTHLVSNQSLSTVAVVLKKAALYIGLDSGISHLAAGLGTPSMVLFGPTNSAYWAPKGDHVTVIQGPQCQCDDWEQVQQCHQKPCLKFSVDLILQRVEELIPVYGKSHFSDFKSQIHSYNRSQKFQTLDSCNH